jgi:hypothetical protein
MPGRKMWGGGALSMQEGVRTFDGKHPGDIRDIIRERQRQAKPVGSRHALAGKLDDTVLVDKYSRNGVHFTNLYFEQVAPPGVVKLLADACREAGFPFFNVEEQVVGGIPYESVNIAPEVAQQLQVLREQGRAHFATVNRRSFVPMAMQGVAAGLDCNDLRQRSGNAPVVLVQDKTQQPDEAEALLIVPQERWRKFRTILTEHCPDCFTLREAAAFHHDGALAGKVVIALRAEAIPMMQAALPRSAVIDVSREKISVNGSGTKVDAFLSSCENHACDAHTASLSALRDAAAGQGVSARR